MIIDISHKNFQLLRFKRQQAQQRGIITTDEDSYVPARLSVDGKIYRVKMRLKGDYIDHLEGDKWSFRFKVRDGLTVWGMKHFSIQDPHRSGYIQEWIFHQLLKHEDLISLRYDFVDVTINGDHFGIFALEENFGKELIENNHRVEGPLLKFDERRLIDERLVNRGDRASQADVFFSADIISFDTARMLENQVARNNYLIARSLLDDFRSGKKSLSQVFDVDRTARMFAVLHLLSGYHAIRWKNIRFHYDPLSRTIEPIAYNLSGPGSGLPTRVRLYYQDWAQKNVGRHHVFEWIDRFFSDEEFVRRYFYELNRISQPGYLEDFFKGLDRSLKEKLSIIHIDDPEVEPPLKVYFDNRDFISETLNNKVPIKVYLKSADPSRGATTLTVANTMFVPVTLEAFHCSATSQGFGDFEPVGLKGKLAGEALEYKEIRLGGLTKKDLACLEGKLRLEDNYVLKDLRARYHVLGVGKARWARIFAYPIDLAVYVVPSREESWRRIANYERVGFLKFDKQAREIRFSGGNWRLTEDLVIPRGVRVVGKAGTRITLDQGACIISYSPLTIRASAEHPFILDTSDGTGQGLAVFHADSPSELSHLTVKDLGAVDKPGWQLNGAVTFYNSDVKIRNAQFHGGKSEDQLNIISSKFMISDSLFEKSVRDALDIDFGRGAIGKTRFTGCGNDCIDVAGSLVKMDSISIDGAGDKAVSVGEKSEVDVRRADIAGADVALASKDGSRVSASELKLTNSRVGYAVYQKKPGFSGGTINAVESRMSAVRVPYIRETGSTLVDGDTVVPEGTGTK
jgi:hypothetical protein